MADEVRKLVLEAGGKLLSYRRDFENQKENLEIRTKDDGSFVTAADHASNEILVTGLRALFPGDAIFSEEIPVDDSLFKGGRVWIIDPLDGTRSFIEGRDDFSVLVALAVDHQVEAGYLFFPMRQTFAWARKGEGAFCDSAPIKVSTAAALRPESVYFRRFSPVPSDSLFTGKMDSGLAFLELSRGRLDGIILQMDRFGEYDVAAPASLITESGGVVVNEKGIPFSFAHKKRSYKFFVAGPSALIPEILALIPEGDK